MMKLMKYLEWREEMAHGVGEVPRVEERHSRVWVPGRPGLLTVTGDRAGQDAVRMSFQPLGSSLFPDVPVWMLPTLRLPTFLLQGDPKDRHRRRLMREPMKLLQAVEFPCLEQRPGVAGRNLWVWQGLLGREGIGHRLI